VGLEKEWFPKRFLGLTETLLFSVLAIVPVLKHDYNYINALGSKNKLIVMTESRVDFLDAYLPLLKRSKGGRNGLSAALVRMKKTHKVNKVTV